MSMSIDNVKVNETRGSHMDFQSNEKYMRSRLQNLGLNVNLASSILQMAPRVAGNCDWRNKRTATGAATTKKLLKEVQIVKINVGNFQSEGIAFTDDFLTAVKALPCGNSIEKDQHFKQLFNRFGQFVVTSAFVGGAVEVETYGDCLEESKEDEELVEGSIGANLPAVVGLSASGKYKPSAKAAKKRSLNRTITRWKGGRCDLHTNSTLESEEKFTQWKMSIANDPVFLTNELSLEPISTLVSMINEKKGKDCYETLQNLFQNLTPVLNRDDQVALDAKVELESEKPKQAKESSNAKEGTTLESETGNWWKSFNGFSFSVYGALVAMAGFGLVVLIRSK